LSGIEPYIIPLPVAVQRRGYSCALPDDLFRFLGEVREMHMVSIDSGMVRGNHVHRAGNEALIVRYDSPWIFAWQQAGQSIRQRTFNGNGVQLLLIPAGLVHALKNCGTTPMHLVSCSDCHADASDTSWQQILE
jgi:dTDP-4-dehydrorhamnose 3,5-epimerase-like enzyme